MMKNRLCIALMMLLFACQQVNAQENFKKTDDWLEANASSMGGRAVLVVYKNGKVVHTRAVNDMNMRQKMVTKLIARKTGKTANTNDFTLQSRQPVASCSKWLSAALVMTFVDEGKLKLTDTVGQYLPALSKSGKGNITISQCLSHLTGVKAPDLKESLQEMRNTGSMDEAIDNIAKLPMEGQPGTVFRYSNVGLQIAGAVIEKISGKSFETLFNERLAKPLNMQNTDFGKAKVALPAGGAQSTPEDYMNFLVMILNKGTFNGKRILTEESIKQMQVNRINTSVKIAYSPIEAGTFGYGYGEWIMGYTGVSSPGLFGSFPWVSNDKQYAGFLMAYSLKSEGRHERYKELVNLVDEAVK